MLHRRNLLIAPLLAAAFAAGSVEARATPENGIVKLRSAYPVSETIARIKQDVTAKKIMFFAEIDQAKLAAQAGIRLGPLAGPRPRHAGQGGTGLGHLQRFRLYGASASHCRS
jgi:hypothetical protein